MFHVNRAWANQGPDLITSDEANKMNGQKYKYLDLRHPILTIFELIINSYYQVAEYLAK